MHATIIPYNAYTMYFAGLEFRKFREFWIVCEMKICDGNGLIYEQCVHLGNYFNEISKNNNLPKNLTCEIYM